MPAPARDQLVVTLIGPGYGECAIIHVGNGAWIVIDSCIDSNTGRSAALDYLEGLGVSPRFVRLLVITHWHDDHIRGISQLIAECHDATIAFSPCFREREFRELIRARATARSLALTSGTDEIANSLGLITRAVSAGRGRLAQAATRLLMHDCAGLWRCEVWSLSPSSAEFIRFMQSLARMMPDERKTIGRLPAPQANDQALATWFRFKFAHGGEDLNMLFGSDLEETGTSATGWSAVVGNAERPRGLASIFKVAHHGSVTGHLDQVWSKMLKTNPWALLTPFRRGDIQLPGEADIRRIASLTINGLISSDPTYKRRTGRRGPVVDKTLRDFGISLEPDQLRLGRITLRNTGATQPSLWSVDLAGAARSLKTVLEHIDAR